MDNLILEYYELPKIENSYASQLKEKLMSQEALDTTYKYELFILSDILKTTIHVVNQYDEKILEFKIPNSSNIITIKYDIYNDNVVKFYSIYLLE